MKDKEDIFQNWGEAHLLSTIGLSGSKEKEDRVSSALLAVMTAVKPFAEEILAAAGISHPKGAFSTFSQVSFNGEMDSSGNIKNPVIPDGAIKIERGSSLWVGLVEVKTGQDGFPREQIENNLELAQKHGFNTVITISNYISVNKLHPNAALVDLSKYPDVKLYHISWARILLTAKRMSRAAKVDDPEQAWILNELIHYLESERSGTSLDESDRMGSDWTQVKEDIQNRTFRVSDKGANPTGARLMQLLERVALEVSAEYNIDVKVEHKQLKEHLKELEDNGEFKAIFSSNKSAGLINDMLAIIDIPSERITVSYAVDADISGRKRNESRVKWILNQLEEPEGVYDIFIESRHKNERGLGRKEKLNQHLRDFPSKLIDEDNTQELKTFIVSLESKLNLKVRKNAKLGTFASGIRDTVIYSIENIGRKIKVPEYKAVASEDTYRSDKNLASKTVMVSLRDKYSNYQSIQVPNWTMDPQSGMVAKKAKAWHLPGRLETDADADNNAVAMVDPYYLYGSREQGLAPIGNAIGRIPAAHDFQQNHLKAIILKLEENGAENVGYFKSSRINTDILELPYPYLEANEGHARLFHPDWYIYYTLKGKPHLYVIEMTKDDNTDKITDKTKALKAWIDDINGNNNDEFKVYGVMVEVSGVNSIHDVKMLGGVVALHHR